MQCRIIKKQAVLGRFLPFPTLLEVPGICAMLLVSCSFLFRTCNVNDIPEGTPKGVIIGVPRMRLSSAPPDESILNASMS